jgi:predicted aconitase with swiveling domain
VSRPGRTQQGRVIYGGRAAGPALKSAAPLSFFGGFDLRTGVVTGRGHPLQGQCVAGRVLVFPTGTGSTVGAFALLRMARSGVAPAALVMGSCDTTVAVGAIIAEIPCVDRIDISEIGDGESIIVADAEVRVAAG